MWRAINGVDRNIGRWSLSTDRNKLQRAGARAR